MKFAEFVWSMDNILSTNVCLQESSDRPLEWFVILMGYAFWNHIHPVAGDINGNYKQLLTTATFMSCVLEIHECQKNPIGKIL